MESITMKKFYRSKTDRRLSGICGGIGEYTDSDPILWRILLMVLFFIPTLPIFILYIITTLITKSK